MPLIITIILIDPCGHSGFSVAEQREEYKFLEVKLQSKNVDSPWPHLTQSSLDVCWSSQQIPPGVLLASGQNTVGQARGSSRSKSLESGREVSEVVRGLAQD